MSEEYITEYITERDPITGVMTTREKRTLINRILHPKTIEIKNVSDLHSFVMISPTPITNVSGFGIEALGFAGNMEFEHTGQHSMQKFRVLSKTHKTVTLDSSKFYVSSYLLIDGKWKCLWQWKEFTSSNNIVVLPRHKEEAQIDVSNLENLE